MTNFLAQLPYTTARIEATSQYGDVSIGTGFYFVLEFPGKGDYPFLVTNKHVIHGMRHTSIDIHVSDRADAKTPTAFYRRSITNLGRYSIGHPNPGVDLAMIWMGGIFKQMQEEGLHPFFPNFRLSNIPGPSIREEILPVENILMVGYPVGISDIRNNLPIIRRGVTATQYQVDYEGRKEFMIDAACFPGSSGSPVLLSSNEPYTTKEGSVVMGTYRAALLGILFAGPQYNLEGKIEIKKIPTGGVPVARSAMPINLGVCIKSERMLEMRDAFAAELD